MEMNANGKEGKEMEADETKARKWSCQRKEEEESFGVERRWRASVEE